MRKFLAGIFLNIAAVSSIYAQTTTSSDLAAAEPFAAASDATAVSSRPTPENSTGLPPGVITEQNPLKLAVISSKEWAKKAYYRPNDNMPDLSNEDLLRGVLSPGKTREQASREVIGSLPRLVVLPCSDGCSGSAYDDAVDALERGYRGDSKNVAERGQMIVRISRLHHRSFLAGLVPTFNDSISIQFVLQGRLVTLSKAGIAAAAHGSGGNSTNMAEDLGALLAVHLLRELGVGIAPTFTVPAPKNGFHDAIAGVLTAGNTLLSAVGTDSPVSSVGPVPDGDVALLPAIDGIGANEVDPMTETRLLAF